MGNAATVAMTPADAAYVKVCAAALHKEAGGKRRVPAPHDEVDDRPDGHAQCQSDEQGHPAQHRRRGAAERPRTDSSRRAGPQTGSPTMAPGRALAEEDDETERDQNQGQGAGRRLVEAHGELGVDLRGQRVETEDLECAELGQHDQCDEHRAAEDGQAGLSHRHLPEGRQPAQAQAARHFLLGRVGVAQARRDGQEDRAGRRPAS